MYRYYDDIGATVITMVLQLRYSHRYYESVVAKNMTILFPSLFLGICAFRIPKAMENITYLRIWKNMENNPVTGCDLGVFLYSAGVAGEQSGTEY